MLKENGPPEYMADTDARNHGMGNRAFMRWVGELHAPGRHRDGHGETTGVRLELQTAWPDAASGPLQLMPKKRKKKAEAEMQQEPPPDAGAPAVAGVEAPAQVPVLPEPAATPERGKAGAAAEAAKKKKKSRVQVALNILRSENVEVFRNYIEAEIAGVELLETLRARINRAQDLGAVRDAALEVVGERLLRVNPEALPGEGQVAEMPVVAPVKTELSKPESVLFAACVRGDSTFIRRKAGHRNFDLNVVSELGTMLAVAAVYGHLGAVRELSSIPGIDVNLAGAEKVTPLYLAAFKGHVKIVRLLLDAHRINPNLAGPDGATPLGVAAFMGHEEIVRLLLAVPNIKVNVRNDVGATALFFAVQQGHVEIVKLLLAVRGVNVNLPAKQDATPLIVAADYGFEEIVKLLLADPYIDVNARKDDGGTALFIATQFGFARIVDLLIRHGADVNLPLNQGTTPLALAIKKGNIEIVRMLLQDPKIRVNQAIGNNVAPLSVAAQYGRKDIVRALLRKGADPNLANNAAMGPLHVACMRGDTAITRMLLDRGAESNMHVTTTQGESCTPYYLARLGKHRDILNMLEAHWRALAARLDALLPGLRPAASTPAQAAGLPPADNVQGQALHELSKEQSLEDEPGALTPPSPAPQRAPPPDPESLPSPAAVFGTQPQRSTSPLHGAADSRPAPVETLSPLAQGKQSLVGEILYKLDEDTLEPLEGIRLMMDVQQTDGIDALCAIYNHLAGMERRRQRARRRRDRREAYAIGPGAAAPAPAPEAESRYAVGAGRELGAEGIEDEIRHHLSRRYHRFVSQAVNNMEFGRGKPTSGYPGLRHVSAGIPGVGSCSVFYYTDGAGKRHRIVGIGHHVDRASYRLDYAAEALGRVGQVLRVA